MKSLIQKLRTCVTLGVVLVASSCIAGGPKATSTAIAQPTVVSPAAISTTRLPALTATPSVASNPAPTQFRATQIPSPTPLTIQSIELSGHNGPVTNLSWSPDGALLASSSGGFETKDFTVRIWRPDGSLANVLTGHTQPVTDLSWSLDGMTLASSSMDGTVRLWNRDGTLHQVLNGKAGRVFALAWSPDGKILASGGSDMLVHLWAADGSPLSALHGHRAGVNVVAWSPGGKVLASGSDDKTVRLWKIK